MSGADAEITVSATSTKSDYFNGLLLNARHSRWTMFTILFVPPLAALWAMNTGSTPSARSTGALLLFALTFLGATLGTVAQASILAGKSARSKGGTDEIIYTFSSTGIAARSAVANGATVWDVWNGAFENAKILIVRSKRGVLIFIPKRGVGENVLAQVRALLATHVVGPVRVWRGAQPS